MRPFERLGAHLREIDGVKGTAFAVWAPDAQRVGVIGDFNTWDRSATSDRLRRQVRRGNLCPRCRGWRSLHLELFAQHRRSLPQKTDPSTVLRRITTSTASIVCDYLDDHINAAGAGSH